MSSVSGLAVHVAMWRFNNRAGAPWSEERRRTVMSLSDHCEAVVRYVADEYVRGAMLSSLQTAQGWALGVFDEDDVLDVLSMADSVAHHRRSEYKNDDDDALVAVNCVLAVAGSECPSADALVCLHCVEEILRRNA